MMPADIHARLTALNGQLVKLDARTKMDSRESAVAKRRAKIVRDIEQMTGLLADAEAQQADRRRRMVLLLAATA